MVVDTPSQTQLSLEEELFPEIKPSYWVNQSNSLINMAQNLTLNERRIIYILIALVQPDDKDFKTYVFRVKDLANLIGYKGNSLHEQVDAAIDGIMTKHIVVYSADGKKVIDRIQWVQRATYPQGEGVVKIKLADDLARFLLDLKSYTKYRLINVLKLASEYSWRLYEILKEDEWKNKPIEQLTENGVIKWKSHRILRVDEIRFLLDVPKDSLKLMKHFKQMLDRCKKELREKTDIVFDYEVHKKVGRKIDSFIFYIDSNVNKDTDIDSTKEDLQSMIYLLIKHSINRATAINLVDIYTYDYLDANIRYVLNMPKDEITNKAGYIVKAIEGNFASYKGATKKDETNSAFYNIITSQIDQKLLEQIKIDNERLKVIKDKYENLLLQSPNNEEVVKNIEQVVNDRQNEMLKEITRIQQERVKKRLPPLLLEDISVGAATMAFEEWEKQNEVKEAILVE